MKNPRLIIIGILLVVSACKEQTKITTYKEGDVIKISKQDLLDKIKGGWAGQVIGCTFGGPTEFKYNGTFIDDYVPIPWDEHRMINCYTHSPGLYDDIYMDMTFVDVFEKYGLDAGDSLHALAFAHAKYNLWHANQAARYINILLQDYSDKIKF